MPTQKSIDRLSTSHSKKTAKKKDHKKSSNIVVRKPNGTTYTIPPVEPEKLSREDRFMERWQDMLDVGIEIDEEDIPDDLYDVWQEFQEDIKPKIAKKNWLLWAAIFVPLILPSFVQGVTGKVDLPPDAIVPSVAMPAPTPRQVSDYAKKYFQEHGLELCKTLSETDLQEVKQRMIDNWGKGEKNFKDSFQEDYAGSKARLDTIYRTEFAIAQNEGIMARGKDAGHKFKVWNCALDERSCPICSSMHGQIAPIDEVWPETDYMRPQDSHPNCRCVMTTLDEEDLDQEGIQEDEAYLSDVSKFMKLNYNCPESEKKRGEHPCGDVNRDITSANINNISNKVSISKNTPKSLVDIITVHVANRLIQYSKVLPPKLDEIVIKKIGMACASSYAQGNCEKFPNGYYGLRLSSSSEPTFKKDAKFFKGFDKELEKQDRLPNTIGTWALIKGSPGNLGQYELDHELGHIAYEYGLSKEDKKEWKSLYKKFGKSYDVKSANFFRNDVEGWSESFSAIVNNQDNLLPKELSKFVSDRIHNDHKTNSHYLNDVADFMKLNYKCPKGSHDEGFGCGEDDNKNSHKDHMIKYTPKISVQNAKKYAEKLFIGDADKHIPLMLTNKTLQLIAEQNVTIDERARSSSVGLAESSKTYHGVIISYDQADLQTDVALHEIGHAIVIPPSYNVFSPISQLDMSKPVGQRSDETAESIVWNALNEDGEKPTQFGVWIDKTNHSEAFADAFMMYSSPRYHLILKEAFPNTYKVMKNILGQSKWELPVSDEASNFIKSFVNKGFIRAAKEFGNDDKWQEAFDMLHPDGPYTEKELTKYTDRIKKFESMIYKYNQNNSYLSEVADFIKHNKKCKVGTYDDTNACGPDNDKNELNNFSLGTVSKPRENTPTKLLKVDLPNLPSKTSGQIAKHVSGLVTKEPLLQKFTLDVKSSNLREKLSEKESHLAYAIHDGSSITLNDLYFGNEKAFRAILDKQEQSGWHPKGCNTPESIVTHEVGHFLMEGMQHKADERLDQINEVIIEAARTGELAKISRYADKAFQEGDILEAQAEIYASVHHTPVDKQMPAVKKVSEILYGSRKLNSLLEDVADFMKLNYNCPESEKVGTGPRSCSGNQTNPEIKTFFSKSSELYNKLKIEDQKLRELVNKNSVKFKILKSGTPEYSVAEEERNKLFNKWRENSAKLYTQLRETSPDSKYTKALSDSDWKAGKLAVLASDNIIMNMSPSESKELQTFSRNYDYSGFPKTIPETNLDLSSDTVTEKMKAYIRNIYGITDADILKSRYDELKIMKREHWPTDQQILNSEYSSKARTLDKVKIIDNIINKSMVPRDVTVYGIVRNDFPGDKFQIDGYISASRTYNGANDMISKYDMSGFPIKILIKAGTPALFFEDFENNLPDDKKTKGSETDPNMREIILPRKLEFNVIHDRKGNKILKTVPTREPIKDPDIDKLESSLDRNQFSYKEVKVLNPGETRLAMIKSVSSLSDSEKRRLVSYTGKAHIVYNQLSGDASTKFTPEEEQRYSKEADELEQILNKTIMPGKLTVIRGVDEEGWGRLQQLGALDENSEFQYNGFMSTSYSKSIAKQYAGVDAKGNRLYVSVTLSKGTPAALIDKVSAYKGEDEILINRNLMFKSFGVSEEEGSGEKILHIEAIPPEQKQNSDRLQDVTTFMKLNKKCKVGTFDDSNKCGPDKQEMSEPDQEPKKRAASTNPRLSQKESHVIEYYTSDGFLDINRVLRGKTEGIAEHKLTEIKTYISRLDSALVKSIIPKSVKTIYRGLDHKKLYENINNLKDKVISDSAFASASTDINHAQAYGSGVYGCIIELSVPEGSKGLYVNVKGLAGNKNEKEILLPRESKYRVISAEYRGRVGYIKAELMNNDIVKKDSRHKQNSLLEDVADFVKLNYKCRKEDSPDGSNKCNNAKTKPIVSKVTKKDLEVVSKDILNDYEFLHNDFNKTKVIGYTLKNGPNVIYPLNPKSRNLLPMEDLLDDLKGLPKALVNSVEQIEIADIQSPENRHDEAELSGRFLTLWNPSRLRITADNLGNTGLLVHELGHAFDGNPPEWFASKGTSAARNEFYIEDKGMDAISGSIEWENARKADGKPWVTSYAKATNRYNEDFADSITHYLLRRKTFEKKFPNRAKFIEHLLDERNQKQKQNSSYLSEVTEFLKLNKKCKAGTFDESNKCGPEKENNIKEYLPYPDSPLLLNNDINITKTHRDIPSISWLKSEREYAKERYEKTGRPITGTLTSSFIGRLPVSMIKNLPGENKEHLNKEILTDFKAKPIYESIKNEGVKEPITIFVNYKGTAYISEGNHRAAIAVATGLKDVPVDVRYFAGGELVNGPWNMKKFEKITDPKYLKMEEFVNNEVFTPLVQEIPKTFKLPETKPKDSARLAFLKKKYGIKSDASYLQEAADYLILQDAAIKLNANCKDEEKIGSGPGSCGGNKTQLTTKYGYDTANKLSKLLRDDKISVDDFVNELSKFPQTLMFRQQVRSYGRWATGLGGWYSDTIFDETRDKEFTGRNISEHHDDIGPDRTPERPDAIIKKEINKSTDIVSVKGKPYSRIRIETDSDSAHKKVGYITKLLNDNNIQLDLLDISSMISLLGAQGMTLASINGSNKETLTLNINGLLLSNEIFDDDYYKKVIDRKKNFIMENKKLPVLSSDAKSSNELSKMIIDHEIGHILLYKYRYEKMKAGTIEINSRNIQTDPEWTKLAKNAWSNGFKSTTHGDSSSEELFAEAYCALENNRKNIFPDELIKFVEKVKRERV